MGTESQIGVQYQITFLPSAVTVVAVILVISIVMLVMVVVVVVVVIGWFRRTKDPGINIIRLK